MNSFEKVKEMFVEKLGIPADKITLESEIVKDLGADSLDLVEMILSMEEEYGVSIPDDKVESIKTVKDVVDIIDNK